jgi:hypothetical protein
MPQRKSPIQTLFKFSSNQFKSNPKITFLISARHLSSALAFRWHTSLSRLARLLFPALGHLLPFGPLG